MESKGLVGRFFIDFLSGGLYRCGKVEELLFGPAVDPWSVVFLLRINQTQEGEGGWSVLETLGGMQNFNFYDSEKEMLKDWTPPEPPAAA